MSEMIDKKLAIRISDLFMWLGISLGFLTGLVVGVFVSYFEGTERTLAFIVAFIIAYISAIVFLLKLHSLEKQTKEEEKGG